MKFITSAVAVAALASQADAGFTSCNGMGGNIVLTSLFQGMQADTESTNTACYQTSRAMAIKFDEVSSSWNRISYSDYLKPLVVTLEAMNSLSEFFVDCDTTNLAKQFANRFDSWSGLMDLSSTIGMAFVKNYYYEQDPVNRFPSKLYAAANEFFTTDDCVKSARAFGKLINHSVYF